MDDINALNNKLQSISRTLEAIQASGLRQEEAIRKCKKERENREKRKAELLEQVCSATSEKGNVLQELESEFAATKKLEIEWESVQFSLTQIPSLIAKECNDYERFSKRTSHHIRDLHRCLLKNDFWEKDQKDGNTATDHAKQMFVQQRAATKEDGVHKEKSLRNQLEIEETKLAYLEYCASTLPAAAAVQVDSPHPTTSMARHMTPPSTHKQNMPAAAQRSRFAPPYASHESAGDSSACPTVPTSTRHTLPAVTPARAPAPEPAGNADHSPFADWEDRGPAPARRLSSHTSTTPPVQRPLQQQQQQQQQQRPAHETWAPAGEKQGSASQVQSLFANYAPLYPRTAPTDVTQHDAEQEGDAAAVCDTQDQQMEMEVDYDFTDCTPLQSAPHNASHVHRHRHGQPAIEIAISTTTTTVTEYTMQRVPPVPPAYSSAFLRDTPAAYSAPPRTSATAGTTAGYAHHSRHPTVSITNLDAIEYPEYPEETVFSHEAYEEQTRLRQEEVPWFKEFKRRRTATTASAAPGPVPLLGNDVRSAFDNFGHGAPTPVIHSQSQWQGASQGMAVDPAPRSASMLSTPIQRLTSLEAPRASTGPSLFAPRSGQQSEVIDLYDDSDSDEGDQTQAQQDSARLPPSGQHHQQNHSVARGSTPGVAFRSAPEGQSSHFSGNRGGQELRTVRQGREPAGVQAQDGRRGFRTGLDIMQAAKATGPSFRAPLPASAFTMIDD